MKFIYVIEYKKYTFSFKEDTVSFYRLHDKLNYPSLDLNLSVI